MPMSTHGLLLTDFSSGEIMYYNMNLVTYISAEVAPVSGRNIGSRLFFFPGGSRFSVLVKETLDSLLRSLPPEKFLGDGNEFIFNLSRVNRIEDDMPHSRGSWLYFRPGEEEPERFWVPWGFNELLQKIDDLNSGEGSGKI